MAINYELLNKGGISLSTNFDAIVDKPLDARQVVPSFDGLQNLIDNGGAFAGMITYVTSEKRIYEVYDDNGTLKYKAHSYTEEELRSIIGQQTTAAMEFKGATASLPVGGASGDMYKVSGSFTVAAENDAEGKGFTAAIGDSIVYDGAKWYLIPSGDDIEDTWRPITNVDNDATLSFTDGEKIEAVVATDGQVKFNHEKLEAAPADVATEEDRKTRTYLTAVEVDDYGHVTNFKTATENVEDTDTTYEFECQVEHSNVHFSVKASDAEQAQEICVDAYTRNETDKNIADAVKVVADDVANNVKTKPAMAITSEQITNWDAEVGAKELAQGVKSVVDTNKETWDKAGTAVQTQTFTEFQEANTQAINKVATDAADALKGYSDAHAEDYTNTQIDEAIEGAVKDLGTMSTKDANDYYTKTEADAEFLNQTEVKAIVDPVEKKIDDHVADLENPHEVTAEQIGLGKVENKTVAEIQNEITGSIADGNNGFVTGSAAYNAIEAAKEEVKKYADDNDTDTTYTAGFGIKIDATKNNEIAIDDSITFIFCAGDASTLVD